MSRVAVLTYTLKQGSKLDAFSKALAEGIQANGNQVDVINLKTADSFRPALYEYLCFGVEVPGLFASKISPSFAKTLEQAANLSGKRAMAFTLKRPFFTEKVLVNIMRCLESQGIFLRTSAVFSIPEDAKNFGIRLDTVRKQV